MLLESPISVQSKPIFPPLLGNLIEGMGKAQFGTQNVGWPGCIFLDHAHFRILPSFITAGRSPSPQEKSRESRVEIGSL